MTKTLRCALVLCLLTPRSPGAAQGTAYHTDSRADLHSVVFVSAQVGLAVGADGTILRTTTGGQHWAAVNSTTTVTLHKVTQAPGGALYAVGDFGLILQSRDQGLSWRQLVSGAKQQLQGVHFPSASTGYAVGAYGTMLRTTNHGRSWQRLPSGGERTFSAVQFPTRRVGYLVLAGSAQYLKTRNAGRTWTEGRLPADLQAHLSGPLLFRDAKRGLLLGGSRPRGSEHPDGLDHGSAAVYRTRDGGRTWAQQHVPGNVSMAVCFGSCSTGYLLVKQYVGSLRPGYTSRNASATESTIVQREMLVLRTVDAGATWHLQGRLVPPQLPYCFDVACPTPASCVLVGEKGQTYAYP
ncbi:WD40/YVTN/BNR-like repeat-containing protein [Hymenobacter glacieicola]|nr:hypothetical protein [Hymenobacter glacieicola]